MHTGYYDQTKDAEDINDTLQRDGDSLAALTPNSQNANRLDASVFLHGLCGFFALALHDKFGYVIEAMCERPEENDGERYNWKTTLIHLYCRKEDKLIDVRGTTNDRKEFYDEFADFFDTYDDLWFVQVKSSELKEWLNNINTGEEVANCYHAAQKIIELHQDYYTKT